MEVAEAIRSRRARRTIDGRKIEDDKRNALVEAARLSASCFNNQPWRFVFCSEDGSLPAVRAALGRGNAWATKAPLIIALASKESDDCQLSDRRNYYQFSCGLAVGQLELQATELGLIAHPIAGYDPAKVKSALGIPEEFVVITLIICGYLGTDQSLLSDKQKASEGERPERKPVGDNFFKDRWGTPLK